VSSIESNTPRDKRGALDHDFTAVLQKARNQAGGSTS